MKIPRSILLLAMPFAALPALAAVIRPASCLPPVSSEYIGVLQRFHQGWPIGTGHIEFANPIHDRFSSCNPLPPDTMGATATDAFSSRLTGVLTMNGINPMMIDAPAAVSVLVTFEGLMGSVRMYNTQITQFDVSGGNLPSNIRLRQSQTEPTLGQTTVETLGNGQFRISSFFDVFTDLSLDGGQTWIPSDTAGHVVLVDVPEPSAALLLLSGAALLALRRRRAA
jgi:hypothetical protein